jgi:hypothetical protein
MHAAKLVLRFNLKASIRYRFAWVYKRRRTTAVLEFETCHNVNPM